MTVEAHFHDVSVHVYNLNYTEVEKGRNKIGKIGWYIKTIYLTMQSHVISSLSVFKHK